MAKIGFVFPGQGSQKAGMATEFQSNFKIVREIFDRADEALKFKLSDKTNKVYLSMRPGLNPIKYSIIDESNRKEKIVVKSGVFMLKVAFIDEVIRRDKEWGSYSNSYYCPIW